MPLRRRPPETSPRVRALLEGSPRARALRSEEDASAAVEPWLPERAWVAREAGQGQKAGQGLDARQGREAGQRLEAGRAPAAEQAAPAAAASQEPPAAAASGAGRAVPARVGRHRRPRPPGPRLLAVPSSLRGARLTGPRAAAAGLLIVVLVAAVGFGARVALARAASRPEPVSTTQSGSGVVQRGAGGAAFSSASSGPGGRTGTGSGSGSGSGGGGPPASGTSATVTVHVVGQVAHEGIVELAVGARVSDALRKAGGPTKGADLDAINLARVLVDGEQIRVPKPGEAPSQSPPDAPTGTAGGSSAGPGGPGGGGQINLNQATAAQLEELPGVGPVLAQRIVEWRTEHGRFTSVDELGEVSGIGEKIFAQLQPKVTV